MITIDNYRIRKYDEHNIVIEEFTTKEVTGRWKEKHGEGATISKWIIKGYYTSLQAALNRMLQIVSLNEAEIHLKDFMTTMQRIEQKMLESIENVDLNTFKGKGTRLLKVS